MSATPTPTRAPTLDRVYAAIADPTRRAMLAALARGELTVGGLADRFPLSLNGVSKHVKVLERAGLVARRVEGREHWLRFEPRPLRVAADWLETYRAFWDDRLQALEHLLVADRAPAATPPRVGRGRRARAAKRARRP
jgi:DNA-binding transcriptional ArsR family regulator